MNAMHKYQVNIAIEVLAPVTDFWDQRKKRPVRMARWRKLSKYLNRCVKGKGGAA